MAEDAYLSWLSEHMNKNRTQMIALSVVVIVGTALVVGAGYDNPDPPEATPFCNNLNF